MRITNFTQARVLIHSIRQLHHRHHEFKVGSTLFRLSRSPSPAPHRIAKLHRHASAISRHKKAAKSHSSPPRLTEHTLFFRQRSTRDPSSKQSANRASTLPAIMSCLPSLSGSKS
uniref:Uncharacterized protein n=1 Tax=Glossina palpalis gambiensis TaxID=67801 RepID=A0A1B0C4F7_9MUSC